MTSTLILFAAGKLSIHPATAWYLSDLGDYCGKQKLYTRRSPQRRSPLTDDQCFQVACPVLPMDIFNIDILLPE